LLEYAQNYQNKSVKKEEKEAEWRSKEVKARLTYALVKVKNI
jgi:cobalamin-dependent methionine synthase I